MKTISFLKFYLFKIYIIKKKIFFLACLKHICRHYVSGGIQVD